ncbi:glucose-6-phosphate isomerase [Arenimonas fontis]|uniref:Glucose-6-phosphate isomerase n=1 Tax=Arenimonas fontis TaxID=2608255 RepID=A0A5B2ZD77_9GAMM|nr:glucose-6-phosphate isomerase [Arenimonas fontis]KAA2285563.1 glucose-6-phosphate isomerase [Arenimonas fontis]
MFGDQHWNEIRRHAERLRGQALKTLTAVQGRTRAMSLAVGPVHACFARQHIDGEAWSMLLAMAAEAGLGDALRSLFDGEVVNPSESRPALHMALRAGAGRGPAAAAATALATQAGERMAALHGALADSPVTDIVHVGIGGSDLGPRLVVDALREFDAGRFRIHFLSNVDGSAAGRLLPRLDPARTAGILVSKSFATRETLLNGAILRDWLGGSERLYAVSANTAGARDFGIAPERVLPMWDWVGGRYSLWSAVGFSIRLALGEGGFTRLLAGAADMDRHVRETPVQRNLAAWHGLTAVWNRNALGFPTLAVLPYDQRLALLPAYLQQLVMESLGKSVRTDGAAVPVATSPVIWGGTGTDVQHSFFQALHQGTEIVPAEFVGVARPMHPYADSHRALLANLLAQAEALANGADPGEAHRRHPGGRPSTLLLLDALTPESLGALLALHEHSVYVQACLWGINAFDQWGVELGKRIAGELESPLAGEGEAQDPVTRDLVAEIRRRWPGRA